MPIQMSSSLLHGFSIVLVGFIILASFQFAAVSAANFYRDFDITWGGDRAKILNNGELLRLSLDRASGSGFQSKNKHLFGKIDMQIKLVHGNSAGTVTAFYLKSDGQAWDEIDFEFLGNLTGDPYTLHTNIFTQGHGNREQQFHLWFDPSKNFHTYSILWTPKRIIFVVDGIAIRVFKNMESVGVAFPKKQPLRLYSTLWDADNWATRGGSIKTDWKNAPFTATFRNFNYSSAALSSSWQTRVIDSASYRKMRWVRRNFMVYNYCTDFKRFSYANLPQECKPTSIH